MISRLLGGLRKRPNASRVSKHRMARFIPNAEIHEPHDELAMRYLAVETRRDMRSITIASNVSGLESSGERFPAKHSVSPAGTHPAVRAGFMKLSSTAFRLMARRDAAGVRLLTHNGLDWSPCQPRPDLQSSWRRLVRGIGATSMPNVLSDLPCCHPNSTAKKISGNSCGRTGCRTEFSNPSTTSSITAATPANIIIILLAAILFVLLAGRTAAVELLGNLFWVAVVITYRSAWRPRKRGPFCLWGGHVRRSATR